MSLGENLQFLRKKQNITQEQLAEMLEVSRQSVSKWESDTTYPEMDKLLQMSNMFHCTLDDLTQKDISAQYVEDKSHYDEHKNSFSKKVTAGVSLILSGLTVMMFMEGIFPQTEMFEIWGGIVFFIFLAIAVAVFIVAGMQDDYFEKKYPFIENFYTKEEQEEFHKKYTVLVATGVVLIFIGLIIVMGLESIFSDSIVIDENIDLDVMTAAVFFLFLTIAVGLFVYAGTQEEKYDIDRYNAMHDKNSTLYKKSCKKRAVCAIIMLTATIVFLLLGFIANLWKFAPVTYGVGGLLCAISAIIINKSEQKK